MTELPHGEVYEPAELPEGPDYVVQFKIRNGPLLFAMRARGIKTVAALARVCGVHPQTIGRYLSLTQAPIKKTGEWSPTALRMADALRLPPESLFPPEHLEHALKRASGEFNVTSEEMQALVEAGDDPEHSLISQQLHRKVHELVDRLPPRQRRVIEARYGLDDGQVHTLEELSAETGTTRERIRQIEMKALDKLAAPGPMHELKAVTDTPEMTRNHYSYNRRFGRRHREIVDPHYVPHWKREEEAAAAAEAKKAAAAQEQIEELALARSCCVCGGYIARAAARIGIGNYFWCRGCWAPVLNHGSAVIYGNVS